MAYYVAIFLTAIFRCICFLHKMCGRITLSVGETSWLWVNHLVGETSWYHVNLASERRSALEASWHDIAHSWEIPFAPKDKMRIPHRSSNILHISESKERNKGCSCLCIRKICTWSWSTSLRNACGKWGNSIKQDATRDLSCLLSTVDILRNEENSALSWKKIPCERHAPVRKKLLETGVITVCNWKTITTALAVYELLLPVLGSRNPVLFLELQQEILS